MAGHTFKAVLIRPEGVGTWTFFYIPMEVPQAFSSKGQVKVKGTVNGYAFKSTALPMGDGRHYLVVAKNKRDQIHTAQGDTVEVTLELDPEDRQVDIPYDLSRELI